MNNGLNFKVCPLQSQRNLTLFYPCVWGSLDEIISKLFPMFPEKHIAPVCGPFYCRTQAQMRASARGCHLPQTPQLRGAAPPPVRVPDESKASFLIPPCWLAPFLPPYHPLMIPFSLASDSVITYHHRPGTLAAVHFSIHSACHCSLKRCFPGPSEQECRASFPVLTLTGPPGAAALLCHLARHVVGETGLSITQLGPALC